jgi:DNA-binding CsgD family transcriptional regulator
LAADWHLERALVWVRWFGIAALMLAIPLTMQDDWLLVAPITVVLVLANAATHFLLGGQPSDERVVQCRVLATVIEWSGGLAVFAASEPSLRSSTPVILIVLIMLTSARFRLLGLLTATLLSLATFALLVVYRIEVREVASWSRLWPDMAAWMIAVLMVAAVIWGLIWAGDAARRAIEVQHESQLIRYRRERSGLTDREWEVLQLLCQGLKEVEIARRLNIGPNTVKTHVSHISDKFEVRGGRSAIVAKARDRHLIDEVPSQLRSDKSQG